MLTIGIPGYALPDTKIFLTQRHAFATLGDTLQEILAQSFACQLHMPVISTAVNPRRTPPSGKNTRYESSLTGVQSQNKDGTVKCPIKN